MKQLDGSFVRSTRTGSDIAVEFHNPSIKDYIRTRIASDASVRNELLTNSLFFEQVSCLVRLSIAGQLTYGPALLTPDDPTVHQAIARTISAKSPTYQVLGDYSTVGRSLARTTTDIGARHCTVANRRRRIRLAGYSHVHSRSPLTWSPSAKQRMQRRSSLSGS